MAARSTCQSLSPDLQDLNRGPGQAPDQGIVRDERGQEQPRDKERAQQSAEQIRSNDELSRTVHPVVRNVPVTRSC